MFKLCVAFVFIAVASASPALVGTPLLARIAAPQAPASTEHAAHIAAFSPIASVIPYSQYAYAAGPYIAAPAPIVYNSGYNVAYSSEPIEQHGYKIAY